MFTNLNAVNILQSLLVSNHRGDNGISQLYPNKAAGEGGVGGGDKRKNGAVSSYFLKDHGIITVFIILF